MRKAFNRNLLQCWNIDLSTTNKAVKLSIAPTILP